MISNHFYFGIKKKSLKYESKEVTNTYHRVNEKTFFSSCKLLKNLEIKKKPFEKIDDDNRVVFNYFFFVIFLVIDETLLLSFTQYTFIIFTCNIFFTNGILQCLSTLSLFMTNAIFVIQFDPQVSWPDR